MTRTGRDKAAETAIAACDAFETWAAGYFGNVLKGGVRIACVDGRPQHLRDVWSNGFCPIIYQHRKEVEAFLTVLIQRRLTGTAVELGLEHGGMHMLLRQVCRKVVTVDKESHKVLRFAERLPADGRSSLVCGDTAQRRTVLAVEKATGGAADVLFIDADHTYEGVRSDYFLYRHLVRRGGVVAFHDTAGRCGMHRGISTFLSQLRDGTLDGRRHKIHDIIRDGTGISYEIIRTGKGATR